jgi:probable HAF family extracellular repeat protein
MSLCKTFGFAIFAAVCLLTTGSAHAQCGPVLTNGGPCATEWSGGSVIDLGALGNLQSSGANSSASSINNRGQAVGGGIEWSGGKVTFVAFVPTNDINDAGQVVGQVVGKSEFFAAEWSGGKVIDLGALPGFTISDALGINDRGQVVGESFSINKPDIATEWSGGKVIDLGGLPGFADSFANSINDRGQVAGASLVGALEIATEWSGGKVIDLGTLPGFADSVANSINDRGQVVGYSNIARTIPEPSTWAMMLLGFAGLAFAGVKGRPKPYQGPGPARPALAGRGVRLSKRCPKD